MQPHNEAQTSCSAKSILLRFLFFSRFCSYASCVYFSFSFSKDLFLVVLPCLCPSQMLFDPRFPNERPCHNQIFFLFFLVLQFCLTSRLFSTICVSLSYQQLVSSSICLNKLAYQRFPVACRLNHLHLSLNNIRLLFDTHHCFFWTFNI